MNQGLLAFLSEETVRAHGEYLNTQKLKWSVVKKSYPDLNDSHDWRMRRMGREERERVMELKCNILFHELYFSSFGERYQRSPELKRQFGSEAEFMYQLYLAGQDESTVGVAIVFSGRDIKIVKLHTYSDIIPLTPILALDLMEHAYFSDYGFDRCAYLKSALSYLNISDIDKKIPCGIAKRKKP